MSMAPLQNSGCRGLSELPSAKPSSARLSPSWLDFSTAALQGETTAVNIHARGRDEKAPKKGARGRLPRMSQQVLSCALAGKRRAHSLSAAVLTPQIFSSIAFTPATPKLNSEAPLSQVLI